jgi:uncharacterized protein YacL
MIRIIIFKIFLGDDFMLKKTVQLVAAALGGITGYQLNERVIDSLGSPIPGQAYVLMVLAAIIFFVISAKVIELVMKIMLKGEDRLVKVPASDMFAGVAGLIIGLLVSVLLYPSIAKISGSNAVLPMGFTVILGIVGFRLGFKKKEDFNNLLSIYRYGKDYNNGEIAGEHKILDTSVIIDGRISDICKTGFVEGTLVIPEFVLEELQHIADSSDLLKRNRGRRGLDILNKIQKELDVKVLIYEGDFEEISEVDSKLVKLAKVLQGKVVTNDYNLNKVCELQGVAVLNINDLANAVKPVVLPGEEILVQVIKDGKEYGQGVAYLDDGTMIVVEGGRDFIGTTLDVLVTSVLQTSAGRMIFAKPKLLERAL